MPAPKTPAPAQPREPRGRLRIFFTAEDGTATGVNLEIDLIVDLMRHGMSTDSNGHFQISISGKVAHA